MKDKILAAIKAKFPGVNLSKKRLEAIAAKIELKVIDDESKIDAALATYDEYNSLAELAKQDDALRNLEAHKKANPGKKEDPIKPIEVVEPPLDENTPAWVKLILEQNKKLSEGLAAIQGEKAQSTIRTKLTTLLSEKGKEVPASYWGKRAIPEKEEELDAFVTDVQTDYSAFKKELTEQGLSVLSAPRAGQGASAAGGGSKEVSPEIQKFVASTQAKAVPIVAPAVK